MEQNYQPSGWLGLLLGTRLWHPFHPAAIETNASFMKQIDQVVRQIGDRGKPATTALASPPPPPPPLPPASSQVGTPGRTLEAPEESQNPISFTPPMQNLMLKSPDSGLRMVGGGGGDRGGAGGGHHGLQLADMAALVNEIRQAAREEIDSQRRENQILMAPQEVITAEQLVSLEERLEALCAGGMLPEEEIFVLEDMIADFLEAKAGFAVVTADVARANEAVGKMRCLIILSEGVTKDET
eukprot:SAG22_NODE_2212_length_2831_cov_2.290996_2_plen_240_part_01